jgi:phosphatidate cytidylyltransferase
MKIDTSLRNRIIVAAIIIPVIVLFAILGGWSFAIFVAIIAVLAAYELWQLFHKNGFQPALALMAFFTPLAVIMRQEVGFRFGDAFIALLILAAMFYHVIEQQRGGKSSATSFFITLGGPLYIGWLGGYAVSIRNLEDGLFWVLLVLTINSMTDTGAYMVGRRFGRHKMFPHVSPQKSWEGYAAGVLTGVLTGLGVAALLNNFSPTILPSHGVLLGLVISVLAPMGDYGESMIKRSFNVKDSSNILLGHGGFLDRIDSVLWAITIGYYLILIIGG